MNEQPTENKFADELLRQEILELIIQHDPRTALRIYARVLSGKETAEIYERGCVVIEEWGKIVDKILAKAKQHDEQKMVELDFIIKRLMAEISRLSNENIISPIDIVVRARAELADLQTSKLKRC